MKRIFFIITIGFFSNLSGILAQGLPVGACAVRFTYDATGSLVQRDFYCNNTTGTVYRNSGIEKSKSDSINVNKTDESKEQIVKINAIAPNPTTGKFTITLAKPLNSTKVMLTDVHGRIIEKEIINGASITFDINNQPAGIYFVRIENEGKGFTFKVVKE